MAPTIRDRAAIAVALVLLGSCRPSTEAAMTSLRKAIADGAPAVTIAAGGVPIELVRIAPGEFAMGSPAGEPGRSDNEGPARRVKISRPFYLGRYEITQAQYRAVMGALPSQPPGDSLPVAQITYAQALEFCRRLSSLAGVTVSLPTEAQWEYACRAGTTTAYSAGASEEDARRVAWCRETSPDGPRPVGTRPPNAWGLYDMHGNVFEMCADYFPDPQAMIGTDPVGERSPMKGAMRGGGWTHPASDCRAARRMLTHDKFGGAGLRIAIDTPSLPTRT